MTGRHYPEEVKQYARKRRMAGDALNEVVRKIYARTGRLPAHKTVLAWCAGLPPFRASKQLWAERWKRRAMELRQQGAFVRRIAAIIEIEAGRACADSTVEWWLKKENVKNARRRRRQRSGQRL